MRALALILLLATAGAPPPSVRAFSLFGKANEANPEDFATLEAYGPLVFKTMQALRGGVLAKAPSSSSPGAEAAISAATSSGTAKVAYGRNSSVTLQKNGVNSLSIYFFDDKELSTTEDWSAAAPVPFLADVRKSPCRLKFHAAISH